MNLNEADTPEVIDLLASSGVALKQAFGTLRTPKFVSEIDFNKCLRVLVEMTSRDGESALKEAHQVLSILDRANCTWPVLLYREDGIHLPNGAVAADNADLVRAARQLRG